MKFCPHCRNMLYDIQEEAGKAFFKCNKCSYQEPLTNDNPVVYDHLLKNDNTTAMALNPYLKFDPTLEHLKNVICPNTKCSSHRTESDVVAVEINSSKLIWMYQCTKCDNTWTQSARKSDDN